MGLFDSIMRSVATKKSSSTPTSRLASTLIGAVTNPIGTIASGALSGLAGLAKQGVDTYRENAKYTPLPYPEMPNIDLQYPDVPYMSQEEAMQQAQGQLGPQYSMSRNNLLNTFQQEKKRLPQMLNARGQLYGGLREGGEAELTQRQAMGMEQLGLQNQSALAELAQAIQSRDQTRAQGIADREFSAMQANAQNAMQKWQTDVNNVWRENDARRSALAQLAEYNLRKQEAERAAQQADRQFGLQEAGLTGMYNGSPTLSYQQYQNSPEAQPWYLDLFKRGLEYDLNKPYFSPSSGGGGTPDEGDAPDINEDISGFVNKYYEQGTPEAKKLFAQDTLDRTLALIRTGVMPREYGDQFIQKIFNVAPEVRPQDRPNLGMSNTGTSRLPAGSGVQGVNPWSGLGSATFKWPWQ